MRVPHKKLVRWTVLAGAALMLSLPAARALAQAPAGAEASAGAKAQADVKTDVLLRGPVHEAFAERVDLNVGPGPVVAKKPPAPIDEVPPDVRPKGENVAWIPGHWAWDDQQKDFIWLSGLWRDAPPGRRWLPGYWTEAEGGHRWVAGTWVPVQAEAISYLPPPQQSLERGPTSEAPSEGDCWIPGSWVHREGAYKWRPGYWAEARPGWIWVPDRYVWTPRGAIFASGYWDYRLSQRGQLFAPVRFHGEASARAGLRFTPNIALDADRLFLSLFVRPAHRQYYFGDYYGREYADMGIYPWYEFRAGARGYDPLLSYYIWENRRSGVDLVERLTGWHTYFLDHAALRPPHTVAGLTRFVADHKADLAGVQHALLGQPLADLLAAPGSAGRFVRLPEAQLGPVLETARGLTHLAGQRVAVEAAVAATAAAEGVVQATANLPQQVLRLPKIELPAGVPVQPLEVVPGVENVLPAVPRVQPQQDILPIPEVPLVPGLLR